MQAVDTCVLALRINVNYCILQCFSKLNPNRLYFLIEFVIKKALNKNTVEF